MRGASGEMRESRAKAQRRRKQSVSSVAVRRRTQKNTLRRATYEHAGLLPISLRLGALARDQFFLLCGSAGAYSFLCVRAKKSPRKGGVPGGQRTPTFSGSDWTPQSRCRALREADARVHSSLRPSVAPLEHRQRYPARAMPCRATGANSLGCEANRQHPCLRLAPRAARPCRPCWSGRSSPRLRRSACVSS